MKRQLFPLTFSAAFTLCVFSISQVQAAPGTLEQTPLFIAAPVQPNIFFLLDDSGSMNWAMPSDGGSSQLLTYITFYHTRPDNRTFANARNLNLNVIREWNTWCLGANRLAYNPNDTNDNYKPWASNIPGTNIAFPNQTDLTNVWVNPLTSGAGAVIYEAGEDSYIQGTESGMIDLSGAPVVEYIDTNKNGQYDVGECPSSFADGRVKRADQLSDIIGEKSTISAQTNFANWFTYYRIREHTMKAAVTRVISTSNARIGMATINQNAGGVGVKDMTDESNKNALLEEIVQVDSIGGTPLRTNLNKVGLYFNQSSATPNDLNISTAAADKPIQSAADGGECQQNFTMLMTDGFWNSRNFGTFGNPSVGNQDAVIDNNFVHPAHQDASSDSLADVAMKWYKTDLAPGLPSSDILSEETNDNNTENWDENNQQHMVTFGIAFGVNGTLISDPADRSQAFNWPLPAGNTPTTVDDLRHAAYNSRGEFLSAGSPEALITKLQIAFSDIEARDGSAAQVSFNTQILKEGSLLFSAGFDSSGWTGDVEAFKVNPANGKLIKPREWSAATELTNLKNDEIINRTIYTWGLDASGKKNGTLFNWGLADPQPSSTILDDLKINLDASIDTSAGFSESRTRLNFIRGNTSKDGVGLIRDRKNRLGDFIHSAPRFVGEPVSNWPDKNPFGTGTKRYSAYQAASSREGVVYAGANDGLLHGFKATNGEEVLAYLPSAVASSSNKAGLHYLSEIGYQHKFYVDGSPISADVYLPIQPAGTSAWRTILVGALGGGGQGLYALDVSDPSQFNNNQTDAEKTVLWEFTSEDDADLGFFFGQPQVAMMNNGEWAVIIGNGYNATGTDHAQLKILFIEKGLDGEWATAGDFITIDTGVGGTLSNKNGLSAPTLIDLDNNGTTDRIYAGDLLGNMWAFDVSGDNTLGEKWKIAHQNSKPLFTAKNAATAQPITMKPLLVKPDPYWVPDDAATNAPNLMVYFGTGQYVATGDAVNTDQQAFYGIWDGGVTVPQSKLVEQTFFDPGLLVDSEGEKIEARVLSANEVTLPTPPASAATATQLGWFFNLPESGERVTVSAFEFFGSIFFNTLTPSSDPCSAGGGSWRMAVDMRTGSNPGIGAFDINDDGSFNDLDKISNGTDKFFSAGKKFEKGIASATTVMNNEAGQAFSFTSETGKKDGDDGGGGVDEDDDDVYENEMNPGLLSGKRKSWIQLFF